MTDYVASQTVSLDDQVSAGADAATAALGKLADAADAASASTDNLTATVTKAGPSAQALANRFDPATKAANDLAKAQADLAINSATMDAAVASGSKTQAQADAVTASLTARVRAAQAAVDQFGVSSTQAAKAAAGMSDATSEAANSANVAAGAHAGLYREIVILGHEVITGNFSRIPGSLVVLAERSGQLENIFSGLTSLFTTLGGAAILAGAAGAIAIGAIGIEASNAIANNIALQNSLRATRDDYAALATEVQSAARTASQATPGLSTADATTAGGIIAGTPDFSGTKEQLTALIELAANMGVVFKETADKAATDLSAAMEAPGVAADKLVGHLQGMTQALANSIAAQADAGDKAGAFARYEEVLSSATDGAAQHLSPLRQAMRDVAEAFDGGSESGKGFGNIITESCIGVVYSMIEALAGLLLAMNKIYDAAKATGNSIASDASGSVSGTINSVGNYLNAPQQVIDLAQKIQPMESSTGMYNAQGQLQVSSTGAIGAMQVEPMNANGNDLTSLQGNVTAAEQLLIHLYTKYNGDQTLVAMAYTWGEGNVDKYLAGQQAVPQSVQTYAAQATNGLPATGGTAGGAVSNNQQEIIDAALKASNNSVAGQTTELDSVIAKDKLALAAMQSLGQGGSAAWDQISQSLATSEAKLDNLRTPLDAVSESIENQRLASQRLEGAYDTSYAAVQKTTAQNQAYSEALKLVGRDSDDFAATVDKLTGEYQNAADAANKMQIAQATLSNGDQLEYLKAETDSLGMNTDARDEMLAHMKAEQELRQKNISDVSAEGQAYLNSVDAISAQSAALAKNQQTISDLENLATQAFDQIGSAITNAFANGGKSALDFGNLARTVLSSVLSEVVKIAALNPILNSVFGGSRTTLGDVGGLLGSLGGGGSVASQADGSVTLIGQASSDSSGNWTGGGIANAGSSGGGISSILSLGGLLFGQGGVGSALGLSGGIGGELGLTGSGGLLSSTLWGSAAVPGETLIGSASSDAAGVWAGGAASAGPTLGGFLGGAGLGFGAGELTNSLLGGNSTGGAIGSAAGALAGAAIGSIIPGIGTLIGGLIGGVAGGGLGGLFGNSHPSDKTEGYNESLSTGDQAATGNASGSSEYSDSNSAAAKGLASTITSAIQGISTAFSLTSGLGGQVQTKVGANGIYATMSGGDSPKFSADFSTAGATTVTNQTVDAWVAKFGTSLDATTQTILKEIDYSKSTAGTQLSALAAATGGTGKLDATQLIALPNINTANVNSATSDLNWIKTVYEPTVNSDASQGSIATQTNAVNTAFVSLIATAQRLGLATDVLTAAQTKQVAAINTAAQQAVSASAASIMAGYDAENGNKAGGALVTFDQNSAQSKQSLINEFQSLYGDSYASQKDYVTQVALLTTTLAEQRADLVASWAAAQIAQADSTAAGDTANIAAGLKAQGTIDSFSGNLGTVQAGQALNEQADLMNFDAQAKVAADNYSQQLVAAYGQGYTTSASYAQEMTNLESSLAEQRLAIQAQYAAQAKAQQASAEQSASGVVANLTGYIQSLETGSNSPVNAQSQYALARSAYQNEAQLAAGGDVTAISELQQYASAFLSASQNVYGSGAQYATDFSNVLAALQAVASIPQDTLTADFMAAALQDQTDILSGNLMTLQNTLAQIQLELSQQNARPN